MATSSKRMSHEIEAQADVKSEPGSELEELNEEEYERERLENIKYVYMPKHPTSILPTYPRISMGINMMVQKVQRES